MSATEVITIQDQDAEAQRLLKEWGYKGLDEETLDDVESSSDADDAMGDMQAFLEKFRRHVHADDNAIDHIILGTSNLKSAISKFHDMTGVKPVMMVTLKGMGVRSARVAFSNDCCFLEIMGPETEKKEYTMNTPLVRHLSQLPSDGAMVPLHYAVRSKDTVAEKTWTKHGLECDCVTMIAVDQYKPWKWDLNLLQNHDEPRGLVPYFCEWHPNMHHAAGRLPIAGTLDSVVVTAPSSNPVHELVGSQMSGVDTIQGGPCLKFTITSQPNGRTHVFSTATPRGIEFPAAA